MRDHFKLERKNENKNFIENVLPALGHSFAGSNFGPENMVMCLDKSQHQL